MSKTKGNAKIMTGVRLSKEQVLGLKEAAKRITQEGPIKVGWTTVIGIAVDEMIANRARRKAA